MKQLLLGPILNGNRERVLADCRRLVAAGRSDEFLYIAATKPLLDLVTERLLDGEPRGVLGRLNVFLLSGFCRWLVSEARDEEGLPLRPRTRIDTPERPLASALVARLVTELGAKGQLGAFGDLQPSAGVVSSIVALLGEIQRAGLGAGEFADGLRAARAARSRGGAVEPDAFDDAVSCIYEAYERIQDESHLTDGCRDYLLARDVLAGDGEDGDVCARVRVPALDRVRWLVVDGFFDVLPVHLSVLKHLVARIADTTILLNEDPDNPRAFSAFGEHIETFLSKQWNFEAERAPSTVVRAGALDRIPRHLFSGEQPPPADLDASASGVVSVEAPDRESEVRYVAKRIKQLVADRGFLPDEIAVVSRDGSRYDPLVVEVFTEEGVASTAPDDRPLIGLAPVAAALRVLEAASTAARAVRGRVPVSRLVALSKSGLLGVTPAARVSGTDEQAALPFSGASAPLTPDTLENVAAYVGRELPLADWLRRARRLAATHDWSAKDEQAARLLSSSASERRSLGLGPNPADALRESAESLERLGRLVATIPAEGDAQMIADALRAVLDELGLGTIVRRRLAESLGGVQFRQALVDLRALDGLDRSIAAVADAARLAGPGRMTVSAFRADLERALAVETVRVADGVAGGVRVLRPGDSRGLKLRAVFILGLVDGEFPTRPSEDWIYPTSERMTLAEAGVGLESHVAKDVLEREEHYCYQAAARATELLVLSRPLIDDDGSETNPSYFLDEIRRALGLGCLPACRTAGSEEDDAASSSTPRELARNAMRLRASGSGADGLVRALGAFARETGALSDTALALSEVEAVRAGGPFTAFDGCIRDAALRDRLAADFAAHTFSASEINDYGACPFQYLLRHVLRLRPRVEAALDLHASDLGVILHEVLRRAVSPLVAESKATPELSRKQLRAVAAEVLARFEQRMPPLDANVWQIEVERISAELDSWIEDETDLQERLGSRATRPTHVEVAFGIPGGDGDAGAVSDPLTLTRGEESIRMRGRIDRIDETASGDVVVYDYKLGTGPTPRDMDEGRDVQMAVYLAAVEALFLEPGKRLAGGGYYALRRGESRHGHGMYREEFGAAVGATSGSRLDDAAFAEARERGEGHVWRAFDRLRAGHFEVVPSEGAATCSRCDYRSVCRFDHTRVRHKLGAEGEAT